MSQSDRSTANPCLDCGACCTFYRVSFYWAEAEACGLPVHLTEQVSPFLSCMAGTNQSVPRCQALVGTVGARVACGVYQQRSSTCRELQPGDEKCNKARARYGLPPIQTERAANW